MATLIKNGRIVENSWQRLEAGADGGPGPLPEPLPEAALLVPLSLWQAHRGTFDAWRGRLGIVLTADAPIEDIAGQLARFSLVAIDIPKFGDGRALSLARLLRERWNYGGEVRAVGEVLHDQLADLRRCGFDAFELRADQDVESALGAFYPFSEAYQTSVDRPLPLFRRRTA